ncbi:hypothetical protein CYQ88_04580 [Hydrogenovibrio sp. SC-1]|nr:hypothetical protein CYQ88_04580 [Hydrogenovibrio sp. SC-1]
MPVDVDPEGNAIKAFEEQENLDVDETWALMDLGLQTLIWLKSEGFISIMQRTMDGKCIGVCLTLKGLSLLGYSVGGQDESETLIDKAKEALTDTAIESAKDVMKKLFAMGLATTVSI